MSSDDNAMGGTERCERCETPIPNNHHSLCGPCGSKKKREQMGHGPQGDR